MAKKHKQPERSCRECIHECACVMQCGYRPMASENAMRCPNYTTTRDSAGYFIGYMEGKEAGKEGVDDAK